VNRGLQTRSVDEADVNLSADVGRKQALEVFESHPRRQPLERHIHIGRIMKSLGVNEGAVDPYRCARDMPGQGGTEKTTGALSERRVFPPPPLTF
jgi:hypothetical protein